MNLEFSLFEKPEFWIILSIGLALTVSLTVKFVRTKNSVKADRGSVGIGGDSNAPITIKNQKK